MNLNEIPNQLPNAYWVVPGKLMAGAYPSDPRGGDPARLKVRRLLAHDFTTIVDLTETGENGLICYTDWLEEEAAAAGKPLRRLHSPIRDVSIPTVPQMRRLLDQMDAALENGERLYVHCWGGRGRIGTVVGCYLVRHGLNGEAALEEIRRLRTSILNVRGGSPETPEQCSFVRQWVG